MAVHMEVMPSWHEKSPTQPNSTQPNPPKKPFLLHLSKRGEERGEENLGLQRGSKAVGCGLL